MSILFTTALSYFSFSSFSCSLIPLFSFLFCFSNFTLSSSNLLKLLFHLEGRVLRRKTDSFCPLLYSPNSHDHWGWARPQPRAWHTIWVFPMAAFQGALTGSWPEVGWYGMPVLQAELNLLCHSASLHLPLHQNCVFVVRQEFNLSG